MSECEFWYHHAGVSVPDIARAIEWWDRMLGFRLLYRTTIPAVPCDMAMIANGNLHVELFEVQGATPPTYDRTCPDRDLHVLGNKHVSFACRDVDAFADRLRARQADIVWVKHYPDGNANIFMRDPFGNLVEFVQYPKPGNTTSTL